MRALISLLARFKGREDGSIAVETVIMLPLMFWAYLAMYSTFDTFRMYNLNQTAAYTVGDAISRETQAIDPDYLQGMQQLFEYLTRGAGQTDMRVSSIWYDEANNRYHTDWSQVRGTPTPLTSDDVRDARQAAGDAQQRTCHLGRDMARFRATVQNRAGAPRYL